MSEGMRASLLVLAAVVLVGTACAHSFLGEKVILQRLFRRGNLPRTMGSELATARILRFAWHLTSIAWLGFAALALHLAAGAPDRRMMGVIVGATFVIHGGATLMASRGRHLAWIAFLIVGVATILATW